MPGDRSGAAAQNRARPDMTTAQRLRAYLVDDEALALDRLERLLADTGRVEVVGRSSDPAEALDQIERIKPEVLFLDIEMPGMTGFELLGRLEDPPAVIFTTAYDRYALRAFQENSVDYLLKPIEPERLEAALEKLERLRASGGAPAGVGALLKRLEASLGAAKPESTPRRLASRIGDRIVFVDVDRVSHFFAQDKLTYAAAEKNYVVDLTLNELEARLAPETFIRVHRSAIVNVDYIDELHAWFGGKMKLRLRDDARTELTVARERVKELKEKLGV